MSFYRKNIDKLAHEVDNNIIIFMLNRKILTIIKKPDFEIIIKLKQDFPLENKEKLVSIYQLFPDDDEREENSDYIDNKPIFIDDSLKKCFEEKDNTIELKLKGRFRTSLEGNKIFDFYSASSIERHNIFVNMISKTCEKVDKKEEKKTNDIEKKFEGDISIQTKYYENGNIMKETWFQNKIKHRANDLPCEIDYYKNGNKENETWFVKGEQKREDDKLPFRIEYYENGNRMVERRDSYRDSKHDLPNIVYYNENGNKLYEEWYKNEELHRENGLPAYISYYENGNKEIEKWLCNNKFYCCGDLPCFIKYYENGNKMEEEWFENEYLFRDQKQNSDSTTIDQINDLPCSISYYESGKIKQKFWTKRGTRLNVTVSYYENGNKEKEWYNYDILHVQGDDNITPKCIDLFGPVLNDSENINHTIMYDENGNKTNEKWFRRMGCVVVRNIDY